MIYFLLTVLVCDTGTVACRWLPVEHYATEYDCQEIGVIFRRTDQVVEYKCTIDVRPLSKDQDRAQQKEQ
jgi:hypothetical protein